MVADSRPEVLAIVQARGGSKGLPGKNIRLLNGHPLIAYSIAAGLAAEGVTRLILSTDKPEIAEIAIAYGAEVPFLRPAEFAADDSPDLPLFNHALTWLYEAERYRPELIVQLRPTSPLRPIGLIDEAINLLIGSPAADCVRSVTIPSQNPYKMWKPDSEAVGMIKPLLESPFHEPYNMPRQALPNVFWQTGHVDVIRTATILQKGSLTGDRILPCFVDRRYCTDIDTEQDWRYVDWLLQAGLLKITAPPGGKPTKAGVQRHLLPSVISLLVLDFDGVLTDNRVWVTEDEVEAVVCNRGDGMGLAMLRSYGIETVVLSTESNPVVAARCRKLGLPYWQGISNKTAFFRDLMNKRHIDPRHVIYVGNDLNDLGCMRLAGWSVAVADAHPLVLREANWVLQKAGGRGAVRELCDLIITTLGKESKSHDDSSKNP